MDRSPTERSKFILHSSHSIFHRSVTERSWTALPQSDLRIGDLSPVPIWSDFVKWSIVAKSDGAMNDQNKTGNKPSVAKQQSLSSSLVKLSDPFANLHGQKWFEKRSFIRDDAHLCCCIAENDCRSLWEKILGNLNWCQKVAIGANWPFFTTRCCKHKKIGRPLCHRAAPTDFPRFLDLTSTCGMLSWPWLDWNDRSMRFLPFIQSLPFWHGKSTRKIPF